MAGQVRQKFVLDENVLILAQKQEDERGNPDDTCLLILQRIAAICHSLIVDSHIWGKYSSQLSRLSQADYQSPQVLHFLRSLAAYKDKLVFEQDPPELPDELSLSSKTMDDIEFVRRAVASKAALITTDMPVRAELQAKGVAARHGLVVLSPGELLSQLSA